MLKNKEEKNKGEEEDDDDFWNQGNIICLTIVLSNHLMMFIPFQF